MRTAIYSRLAKWLLILGITTLLVACGGGGDGGDPPDPDPDPLPQGTWDSPQSTWDNISWA